MNEAVLRKPGAGKVAALYSVIVALFLFIGARVQQRDFYSGVLITEFLLILAPAVGFLILYKYDVKRVLRLNPIGWLNLLLIFLIMVCAIPVVSVFNLANLMAVKALFGKVMVVQPPAARSILEMVAGVLVIGGSAGICEEVLFRGVAQRSFERYGIVKAILFASFLFGLMHVDFQKLFGTFILGALIGFIVYRTNSIFGGMFAHFVNNSTAVVVTYISTRLSEIFKASGMSGINSGAQTEDIFSAFANMPRPQLAGVIIVWSFIFLFFASILTGLFIAFIRTTEGKAEAQPQAKAQMQAEARPIAEAADIDISTAANGGNIAGLSADGQERSGFTGLLLYLPGIFLIGIMYLIEGVRLRGMDMALVNSLLKLFKP